MPPIGYPGNSISKEARAKAGGGFESAMARGASTGLQHGALASISGSSLPVHGDHNQRDYTWQGERFLQMTMSDFAGGKPAGNTQADFEAAFNGIIPGATGTFHSDWESLGTDDNYNKGQKVLTGGPSRSGHYVQRGRAQSFGVFGWWFRMPTLSDGHPFYCSFKVLHNWYAPDINPPKIFRYFYNPVSGQSINGNVYLNQAGIALGLQQYRSSQEYPSQAIFLDNDPNPGPQGSWHHIEVVGDALNDEVRFYINGVEMSDKDKPGEYLRYYPDTNMTNRTVDFPNTFNQNNGFGNAPAYPPGDVNYTDIMIDIDRYRLMLTDSAVWGSETIREPQPITASSSTEWSFRVNLGEHVSGEGLYAHIIDNYSNTSVYSEAK